MSIFKAKSSLSPPTLIFKFPTEGSANFSLGSAVLSIKNWSSKFTDRSLISVLTLDISSRKKVAREESKV